MATHYADHQWEASDSHYEPRENATRWLDLEDDINREFEDGQVLAAAKQLKKTKSAKPTGWPNERIVIMLAVHTFKGSLLNIFKYMLEKTRIPQVWLLAIVVALYKKG